MYARLRYFCLSLVLAAAACNCDDPVLIPSLPGVCEPTYACPAGFEYRLGDCREARCQVDSDCCPGQACNAGAGFCFDKYTSCTSTQDCLEFPGQECIDFHGGQFCGYPNKNKVLTENETQRCDSNDDCATGRTCVGHRCITHAPCDGGCGEGEVCDLDSNACYPFAGCEAACADGQIAVLEDPDKQSGPLCCKLACECVTLPPVHPGQYGWYAALAVSADAVLVSAYDPIYGDLVVAHFDEEGAQTAIEYVDGFPDTGPLVGDPMGPRGGRSEFGPNVGEHTAIIVDDANVVHVAYRDVDAGGLRYASFSGGVWTKTSVDSEGDTGFYTSIAIGPDGSPRIAYMMAEGTVGADPTKKSALKYAEASTSMPTSPSDWSVSVVVEAAKPELVCGGDCGSSAECVELGNGPECQPTTIGCGGCDSGQVCIDRGGMGECAPRVPIVIPDDLVEGVGLFADLEFGVRGEPMIAYYDRLQRYLRLATQTSTGGFRLETLDGNDPMDPIDAGQHCSIAKGPNGEMGIAYMDATNHTLKYIDLVSRAIELVDDGLDPPNRRFVGADASLLFDGQGRAAIAYQDPTEIDVVYARRLGTPPMWSTEVIYGDPPPGELQGKAAGFFVSQGRRAETAYISTVDVSFTEDGERTLDLGVLTKLVD